MKEYNATLIDYGEGKGKLVVESEFGKVTFAVKADSHMWVELERPTGEWLSVNNVHVCSECKKKRILIDTPYCPWCGKMMDNVTKEGDEG